MRCGGYVVCGVGGYSGGYKMVWRFQYYSCVSVRRHHSASVPRNALSPRWSLDRFRNCCPRRRVQLRRRTSSSSSTIGALSHPRIACSTSTAPASILSPLPCSASCMQMLALTSRHVHFLTSFLLFHVSLLFLGLGQALLENLRGFRM